MPTVFADDTIKEGRKDEEEKEEKKEEEEEDFTVLENEIP